MFGSAWFKQKKYIGFKEVNKRYVKNKEKVQKCKELEGTYHCSSLKEFTVLLRCRD